MLGHKLPPDHPFLLRVKGQLATCLRKQKKYAEAEKILVGVIAGLEKKIGVDHPQTQAMILEILEVYKAQGRRDKAEAYFKKWKDR